jgi:FkbH-like protein
VCSKNQDAVARAPFRSHPEMLLKEDNIAVFQANWQDKATNITATARELSFGLESLVCVDDNPAKRGLVRELLPQVAVPGLPPDPAHFARTLAAAGYFEAVTFSSEDARRGDLCQQRARRAALESEAGSVESYLESPDMQITFSPFDAMGRARITQLISKSNQYNLTTRRYTEAEVAAVELDPACFTLQVRLTDICGDKGMISVVICRTPPESAWYIDTWLMSCRVLGRRVEHAVLNELLLHAAQRGFRKLCARFVPTDRNGLVVDHYRKLGFSQVAGGPGGGETAWELPVGAAVAPTFGRVERSGCLAA